MNKKFIYLLVFIVSLGFFYINKSDAQEIDMSGKVGFDRVGGFVTLTAGRIENLRRFGNISGSIALQLWATTKPYYGQDITGYKIAEANIGEIFGGYYYENINEYVPFYEPPSGYYNVVLVVAESNGYEYLTVDWHNFAEVENFAGLPPFNPINPTEYIDLIDEYVGTWEGTQNFVLNGSSYETTSTSIITRFQNTGFYSKAYVRTAGNTLAEGETWQFDNGNMYGVVKSQGVIIGTAKGTWRISGRSIISNISAVAGNFSYSQIVDAYFRDSYTMELSTSTSYGLFGSGTAKKISTVTNLAFNPPLPPEQADITGNGSNGGGGGGGGGSAPSGGGSSQVQKSKKGKKSSAKKSVGGSKKSSAKKSSGSGKKKKGERKK